MLKEAGALRCLSQMPVVLIPIHFDRPVTGNTPSCQRSVVIRTFLTSDFMTGVPAQPGKQLPQKVCLHPPLPVNTSPRKYVCIHSTGSTTPPEGMSAATLPGQQLPSESIASHSSTLLPRRYVVYTMPIFCCAAVLVGIRTQF